MLFGGRSVWAIVTESEKSGQRGLFLRTKDLKELRFDFAFADAKAGLYANANPDVHSQGGNLPFSLDFIVT